MKVIFKLSSLPFFTFIFAGSFLQAQVTITPTGVNNGNTTTLSTSNEYVFGNGSMLFSIDLGADGDLKFFRDGNATTGTEVMRILDSTGEIGIGTGATTPRSKLDVNGDLSLSDGTGAINFYAGSEITAFITYSIEDLILENEQDDVILDAADDLILQAGSTTRMTILNTGEVGIGTTTPVSQLHVRGNSGVLALEGSDHAYIEYYPDGVAAGRKAFVGYNSAAATVFTIDNDLGDINLTPATTTADVNIIGNADVTGKLFFGSIESFEDGGASTIAANSTLRPLTDNTRDLGTTTFRWNEVWATDGSINTSDARMKKNIKRLPYGMNEILKLNPVMYYWNEKGYENKPRIGFIAQEVQTVLKEVVRDENYEIDEDGSAAWKPTERLGLAYSEIIPVVVAGMQEQQVQIEELKAENETLKSKVQEIEELTARLERLEALLSNNSSNNTNATLSSARLEQNQPNPFNSNTVVRYFIPETVRQAEIRIFDISGKLIKTIAIDSRGEGQAALQAQTLSAGTYLYSLVLDGQVLDSKQMVLTPGQ